MHNHQVGTALFTLRPPTFENCYRGGETIDVTGTRVRGGTWTEDDATQDEEEMDEVEEVFNITNWNRGEKVSCDLFPKSGFVPQVGDVLEESAASAARAAAAGVVFFDFENDKRRYVVRAPINTKQFGKRPLIKTLKLYRGPACDTTQIETES